MNNIFTVVLSVLVGILAGVSLLLGINNTIVNANIPILVKLSQSSDEVKGLGPQIKELKDQLEKQQAAIDALASKTEKISTMVQAPRLPQAPAQVQAQADRQAPPSEDFNKVYDIPVGDSPIIGKKDAPVTIVMFSDFECPFCHRFYPAVKDTVKNYPDKVRLIIKNFPLPFHPNARPAAKAALAANEQGKYQEMMEALLENKADASEAKLKEYSQKIGINHSRLLSDLKKNDAKYEAIIEADMKLVQSSDVRGTPTFFVNGKKAMGRTAEDYKKIVEGL